MPNLRQTAALGPSESTCNGDSRAKGHKREPHSGAHHSARGDALWIVLIGLIYFAAARFSLSFLAQPKDLVSIWPPAGIFLSALLLSRRALRPFLVAVLFLTVWLAEALAGRPWFVSGLDALAHASETALSTWLLVRFVGEPIAFRRTREVIGFLLFVVVLSNAVWSAVAAAASQLVFKTGFANFWAWRLASDGVGNLLVSPFILSWALLGRTGLRHWNSQRVLEGVALFLPLLVLNYVAFGYLSDHSVFSLLHAYVTFPFLLWAALRFGVRGVSSALLLLAAMVLHFVAEGRDTALAPDADHWNAALLAQLYLALLAGPSLLLAAVVMERQQSFAGLQAEIAERQRAEAAQARLTAVIESTSDLVSTATPDTTITYLNRAGRQLAGLGAEDSLTGRRIGDFHPPWALKRITEEGLPAAAATGHWVGETALLRRDGREVPVSQVILAHRSLDGVLQYYSTIMRDITRRKQAEAAQQQARRLLQDVLDTVPVRVFWKDRHSVFLGGNLPFARDAGLASPEALIGKSDFELTWREQAERYRADDLAVMATGIPKIGYEEPQTTPQGDRIWLRTSKIPLRDAAGNIIGVLGTYEDITERKEAEALLQSQAKHLEKLVRERTAQLQENLAELEAFSYTIAHDMRAPLRAIVSYGQLFQQLYEGRLSDTGTRYLSRITEAALRMDQLIQDVLALSQLSRTQLTLKSVDVDQVLQGILHSYPAFEPPQVQIQVRGPLPHVLANEATLTQCISNLLGNAVKFVSPGTLPRIEIWAEPLHSPEGDTSSSAHSPSLGPSVRLWFADNGIGIAPDQQERIFDIFQRVDKSYEGTGIGLAIVRKAMQRMGGTVGVESALGQGSRFWLEFRQPSPEGPTP